MLIFKRKLKLPIIFSKLLSTQGMYRTQRRIFKGPLIKTIYPLFDQHLLALLLHLPKSHLKQSIHNPAYFFNQILNFEPAKLQHFLFQLPFLIFDFSLILP